MSALPRPEPGDRRVLVTRFLEEYREAIYEARRSAEHTATPGWRSLCERRAESGKERRRGLAARLAKYATQLEDFGLGEDDEKDLKDIVKESADVRSVASAFDVYTVQPVLEPARKCQRLIMEATAEAERIEKAQPLIHVGLVETLRMAVERLPKAVITRDSVEIIEP